MEIKTVAVHYERKFNLGDYNSATVGVNLWADLDTAEDDEQECLNELWKIAKDNVKEQSLPLISTNKSNPIAPKVTAPPPTDDAWAATAEPAESQAVLEAQAQAIPTTSNDLGLVNFAPKAGETQAGTQFQVMVNEYKATDEKMAFYRSGAQYPIFTHYFNSDYAINKLAELTNNWEYKSDNEQHSIPDTILTVVCSDKLNSKGNPYRNLEGVRRA